MALKRGIVELEGYQNKWQEEYQEEAQLLSKVLGSLILELHHVGSTSIPGLKAKPIIDMLLVVKNFDEIAKITDLLKPYDYENRGKQGIDDRYFLAKGPDDARTHYLHITIPHSNTYYNQLYFKKYLLDHPQYITKYMALKETLAQKYALERPKYTAGKDAFIKEVVQLAKNEYDNEE